MRVVNLILASAIIATSLTVVEAHRLGYRMVVNTPYQGAAMQEADLLSGQVVKLFEEGKYKDALPLAKRVLAIREKELGGNSKPVAVALYNLARIYLELKTFDQAETLFEKSLAVFEKLNDTDNSNVAKITDSLGRLSYRKLDYDQAEAFFLRSLSIREKSLGPDHAEVAQYLNTVVSFYRSVGRYKEAALTLQRIVGIKEKAVGAEHSELGEVLEDYACALREADRKAEGKKIEERVNRMFDSASNDGAGKDNEELNGRANSLPAPQYPMIARYKREFGKIRVRILIDESGKVLKACAVGGPQIFHDVSQKAALSARFTPTLKDGKPVKVIGVVIYNFTLEDKSLYPDPTRDNKRP